MPAGQSPALERLSEKALQVLESARIAQDGLASIALAGGTVGLHAAKVLAESQAAMRKAVAS
jgi:hypothetical protein